MISFAGLIQISLSHDILYRYWYFFLNFLFGSGKKFRILAGSKNINLKYVHRIQSDQVINYLFLFFKSHRGRTKFFQSFVTNTGSDRMQFVQYRYRYR
jgi:hypothetical protein